MDAGREGDENLLSGLGKRNRSGGEWCIGKMDLGSALGIR